MNKNYYRRYKKRVGQASPLRAKRNQATYKSVNAYIDAVYRNNKKYLDSHIENFGIESKRQTFKKEVLDRLRRINPETGKRYTLKQAIDQVQRTTIVTSAEERRAQVSMTRIQQESPEDWKEVRKAIGWKNKFEVSNIVDTWSEGKMNYYRYKDTTTGKDVIIVEEISPKNGYTKTEVFEFNKWKEKYLESKASNDPAAAAELAVLKILNKGRG